MLLRDVFIHIALDIEHNAKIKLLSFLEDKNVDDYKIIDIYKITRQKATNCFMKRAYATDNNFNMHP